ncbi:hypothetical protein LWI28_025077 [Acer negundo]|uniref:LOB domain-containing protein n=1 Tax=Acer negundo TaxID=4023 RepID=A0AAD5JRF1_ACENE|nr:hypothetical protein LWI28_025077 [Acer negundo]
MEVKERADEESRRLGQIWEEKEYKEALEAFNEKNIASYGINGGSDLPALLSSTRSVLTTSLKNQIMPCIDFLKGFLQTDENLTRALLEASQQLPIEVRGEAADSLTFEAQCRIQNPVYGCVGLVHFLQQQIHIAESQVTKAQVEIAVFNSQSHQPHEQLQLPLQLLQQFKPGSGFNNTINTTIQESPEQVVNLGHFDYFHQA